ncbi:MAG: TRL-like family protein [Bryobacterales bacterium]
MRKLLLVPGLLLALVGCAAAFQGQGAPGGLFVNAETGLHATNNNIGKKKGEACAMSILGLVTTGDAGIRAAASAGGITQISAVDSKHFNILGIYSKYCTIVSGTSGGGGGGGDDHP